MSFNANISNGALPIYSLYRSDFNHCLICVMLFHIIKSNTLKA